MACPLRASPPSCSTSTDTLRNTYDHEIASQFGYTPASNAVFVNAAAFPAVFYMPQLVSFAASHGYAVFFITGRPQTQTVATIKNLTNDGYRRERPPPGDRLRHDRLARLRRV